ncbi:MAG: 3-oxoacyl-ACP reductase [Candidatus Woesebacteria bacterium GW2011_GWB1_39_12]|uniref:3-oxoacyl-ACP reductase n=2 Tax=Candidatus Woeseibacteriota TaxID=1752722 RepID=A0A0G0M5M7_9BACT|nr:MAG: 3-oxoacyl-ACP reductase [Candidatus Woesebacteria bacterium GW2011_GWA1_39_12]KKR00725.1 MAG: 3-oxoacyl-ACP reductase [Candidatus Woesebacteria bacterium GW2011_GWB1_39_12]
MNLKNKVVLVTGASKGIGRATAIAFAKEGCSVVINFKSDLKSAQEVLNECNKYSKGNITIKADVTNENEVKGIFKKIKDKFTHLDVLVNNAGIFDSNDSPTNIKAFENVYENNFLSCVLVTKYALELMNEGKIVNVSSIHGRLGHGSSEAIAYSAFKAALESYTKNLAKELAPKILVNAIAPGRVATPMWGNPDDKEQEELGKVHLIKRMIQPEEIAESIVYLVKNDAVCGEILTVDGGMSLITLG